MKDDFYEQREWLYQAQPEKVKHSYKDRKRKWVYEYVDMYACFYINTVYHLEHSSYQAIEVSD